MPDDPLKHEGHDRSEEGKEGHEHRPHSELEAEEEILAELNDSDEKGKQEDEPQS